nr:hypothetical protein [uncultured Flavobacterium sp.]
MKELTFILDNNKSISTNDIFWLFENIDTLTINEVILNVSKKKIIFFYSDFSTYINNEISFEELIKYLNSITHVRNTEEIEIGGYEIEQGTLWILKGKVCSLVNTDLHLTFPYSEKMFSEII